jgi:CDP-paratose 2-epimerase
MMAVRHSIDHTRGEVFNLGGGTERAVSVMEMLHTIEHKVRKPLRLKYSRIRPGDQPLYIADTSKLEQMTGWHAHRSIVQILDEIHQFWRQNHDNITPFPAASLEAAPAFHMEAA